MGAESGACSETLEMGGFSMDYIRFGSGDEPLVILPGLSVQSVMLAADAVVQAYAPLTSDFTVYLLDQCASPPDPYSVSDMARDTYEAIRALGLSRVCLFGVSLGGMMGLELAINHPDMVRRLVLGSTAACVSGQSRRLLEQWVELAERGDVVALYQSFAKAVYPPNVFEQLRDQMLEAAKAVTDEELQRFAVLARGAATFDVSGKLGGIACPVLAIGSEDDQVLGAHATQEMASQLAGKAGFEMHLYNGYGHAAYDTAPDYKDRLLRFFTA